jgi:Na+-translocating ferredoxin:NAD+ oxidoreductase RnfE subunit
MRVELFDPTLYVYLMRTTSALNVGGEMTSGRIYKVDLSVGTCTCCIPQLLHVPCSHMIDACTVRGVSWLAPAYTTQLYSKETNIKDMGGSF